MAGESKIEWCDAVWNPVRGCSRVSSGCTHCYAERVAARFSGKGRPYEGLAVMKSDGPHWTGKVRLVEELLDWPLRWRGSKQARAEGRPSRIFVNSMSDLFHEALTDEEITRVFDVMLRSLRKTPHIFQILTKRPRRMLDFCRKIAPMHETPNIYLGVSVEDRPTFLERVALLRQTPAAVRFISYEPALGSLGDVESLLACGCGDYKRDHENGTGRCRMANDLTHGGQPCIAYQGIDWLIVGGESGPGARPMHPDWACALREQCQAAGVPFFFKQWGEWSPRHDGSDCGHLSSAGFEGPAARLRRPVQIWKCDLCGAIHRSNGTLFQRVGKKAAGRLLDGREWNEFPVASRGTGPEAHA